MIHLSRSALVLGLSLAWVGCGSPPAAPPAVPDGLYSDVSRSLDDARQAVLLQLEDADAWGTLAMLFDAHDLVGESETCYRQAQALAASDPRWPYLLAHLLVATHPAEAEALLRQAMKVSSQPEPGVRLAALLRDRGDIEGAAAILRLEAAAEPNTPRIHYELARCLEQAGNLSDAIDEVSLAARLAPGHRSVRELAAELLYRAGRLEEGRREAAIALRLPRDMAGWPDPWREAVRNLRRDPHWQASTLAIAATAGRIEPKEALSKLASLASAYPDDWTIGGEFAQLLLRAGALDDAIQAATTALGLHPEAVGLWKIRGTAHLLSEHWEEAEADLLHAVAIKPDDMPAWSDLAFVQEQLGRDTAVDSLETAIRLAPLDIDTHIRLIELFTDRRQFEQATHAIDAMADVAPEHPAIAELRASVAAAATASEPPLPPSTPPSD
jgi:Flp pilus assembly protein TadD